MLALLLLCIPMLQHVAGFFHTDLTCCLSSSLQLSFSHFMYCVFVLTLLPYKHASYFLLQLTHLFNHSEIASARWTLKG